MENKFKNPSRVYGGLDLWMINDALEDDVLREQVREFYDKGCYSVIARTYNGLKSDYPGESFMGKIAVILDEAKKVGLKIALQAGYMPAACPDLPAEFALSYIKPIKTAELKGDEVVISTHGEWSYTEYVYPHALNMFCKEAVDHYVKYTYGEMWKRFEGYFGDTVIGVWVDEPRWSPEMMPCCKDMREDYQKIYGESLDEQIYMLYENEGDYKKLRHRFYTLMEKKMERSYFATVRDWCHSHNLQFCGHLMAEDYTYTQVGAACANMPFYRYFDIPGIDVLRTEQNWAKMPKASVDYMRYPQIKTDGVLPNAPASFELDHMMYQPPRQLMSAALQAGKKQMLCEMYAVTAPDLNFRDQMHLFDFFAAHGINHQCCHAMFYSIKGFRKRFYPQQFNTYQPFWTSFGNVKSYVKRVSNFVSMGAPTTDCLVLHPLDTTRELYRVRYTSSREPMRDAYEYDERFFTLQKSLLSSQIDFHFGDSAVMCDEGSVKDGRLIVGQMSYKTLVLPEIKVLRRPVFELIKKFASEGGEVLISCGLPCRIDGVESDELSVLATLAGVKIFDDNPSLVRYLAGKEKKVEYISDEDISSTIIHRRTEGGNNYFMVFNRDCLESKTGSLVLKGKHKATSLNALDGSTKEMHTYFKDGKTYVDFTNHEGGSTLIYTTPAEELPTVARKKGAVTSLPIDPEKLELHDKNLMTLEYCSYKLDGESEFSQEYVTERIIEILRDANYEGNITMRFRFLSDHEAKGVRLICEEPELCNITLNGVPVSNKSVGYHYERGFEILDLPDVIKEGENVIEISRHNDAVVSAAMNQIFHLFELFRAPKGTDLERLHLIGDFNVTAYPEMGASAHTRINKRTVLSKAKPLAPTADITRQGYPFYVGSLTYTYKLDADADMLKKNVSLKVGKYGVCTANVEVNGKKIGSVDRNPYEISLEGALKEGENEIKITGYTSLRNAIGPMHVKNKEIGGCSKPEWYNGHGPDGGFIAKKGDFNIKDRDSMSWTENFQLVPTGIGDVTVEIK